MAGKHFSCWNRRQVLTGLGAGTAASFLPFCASLPQGFRYFQHGVASGDPLHDRVIIWTRITSQAANVRVAWELAEKPEIVSVAASGEAHTGPDSDYTIKVDVTGLRPGQRYYYRFRHAGSHSITGTTKTLPVGAVESVSMAFVSCSNYPAGYFNVYDAISRRTDIDVVLHLGDYIYEYGMGGYNTDDAEKLHRVPQPRHEITSLSDYRLRYAQYRTDPHLQAMHARLPMIAVWDDHEYANNAYRGGAQNHGLDEGDWQQRMQSAGRVFREWMPVRDNSERQGIYRSFDFGDLASLIMLDTRIEGRDLAPELDLSETDAAATKIRDEILNDPTREMLGQDQAEWLRGRLTASADSGKPWQVLGQQVVLGSNTAPDLSGVVTEEALAGTSPGIRQIIEGVTGLSKLGLPANLDAWDGYPAARHRLYADFWKHANNAVVLSGDSHSAGAFDLRDAEGQQVGVEFAATSVTSSALGYYLPDLPRDELHDRFQSVNPDMRFLNVFDNGFCVLNLDRQSVSCQWHVVSSVLNSDYDLRLDHEMSVNVSDTAGTASLKNSTA